MIRHLLVGAATFAAWSGCATASQAAVDPSLNVDVGILSVAPSLAMEAQVVETLSRRDKNERSSRAPNTPPAETAATNSKAQQQRRARTTTTLAPQQVADVIERVTGRQGRVRAFVCLRRHGGALFDNPAPQDCRLQISSMLAENAEFDKIPDVVLNRGVGLFLEKVGARI